MTKLQEKNISMDELLARAEMLDGNFSVYYDPENICSPVYLDGDKYVDHNGQPIRVRRCSASDFVAIIRSKIKVKAPVQTNLF